MKLLSHPTTKEMLRDGDHVYRHSTGMGLLYTHHGIYDESRGRVIHFDVAGIKTGKGYKRPECTVCWVDDRSVRSSCVDCFLKGRRLYRCKYDRSRISVWFFESGSRSSRTSDPTGRVVERAREALRTGRFLCRGSDSSCGRWRPWNNCESFAYFCITGKYILGKQVYRALVVVGFKFPSNAWVVFDNMCPPQI